MNENVVYKWRRIFAAKRKKNSFDITLNSIEAQELIDDIERGDVLPEIDPNQIKLKFK